MDTSGGSAQPTKNTQPRPEEDFDQSAGRRARRLVGVTLAVTAALAAGGDQPTHSSSSEAAPVPRVQFDSQNKIENIKFTTDDAIGRTQEIIRLLREQYITNEYWAGVVVLKAGTKLKTTPNNQTLELPNSVENNEAEAGLDKVPEKEAWVIRDPSIFGTIKGSDYLYFEVDGKIYWLEITSAENTASVEWYLADDQSGQVNQVQFDGKGKRISPPPNQKEGPSFKRIDRGDWHRYLESIGVDKGKPPTDILPSGY